MIENEQDINKELFVRTVFWSDSRTFLHTSWWSEMVFVVSRGGGICQIQVNEIELLFPQNVTSSDEAAEGDN